MHDLKKIEENVEAFKNAIGKRNFDLSQVDKVLELNKERKRLTQFVETNKAEQNKISKLVGEKKKKGEDASLEMSEVAKLKSNNEKADQDLSEVQKKLDFELSTIPNLLDSEVPVGKDETQNKEVKKWGTPKTFSFKVKDHVDVAEGLKMLDTEIAGKITGSRFYVLKDKLATLERAIANFMIDFHLDRGYMEILPPYIVHERALFGTGNLPKFADQLFKLEGTEWYLIPTAEVPVTNLKREMVMDASEFPLRYVSFTPCFRSEAGSYGKDTRGLIRVHQFQKVEMVNIVHPETSDKHHQDMFKSGCDILEALGLPYRAVMLCSGDIGFSSQKTYDLEVWVPSQNTYREISSISNCGDFQARRAGIRFKDANGKPQYAHTLNGSGLAVGRTLVAILENYQNEDGSVTIPEKLRPYMRGLSAITKN
jgi:seryl-tRNA synthetase